MYKIILIIALLGVIVVYNSQQNLSINIDHIPQTYYVDSVGGNDNNDGTSTGTAWKTITKVNYQQYLDINFFGAGDQILFKNGSFFQNELYIKFSGGDNNPVTISNYGDESFPKPYISGGKCLTNNCEGYQNNYSETFQSVGNDLFAIKIINSPIIENGDPENFAGVVTSNGKALSFIPWLKNNQKLTLDDLKSKTGSFSTFDFDSNILYVRIENLDPENIPQIVASFLNSSIMLGENSNIKLKNIKLSHNYGHCLYIYKTKNLSVENMDISFCGGKFHNGNTYLGNGIEISGNSENITVHNNTIFQVYDSGITPQTYRGGNEYIKNISITNNTISHANLTGIEVMTMSDSEISDIQIIGNKIFHSGDSFSKEYHSNRDNGGPGILIIDSEELGNKSSLTNINISENIITDSSMDGIIIGKDVINFSIKNNTLSNNGCGITIQDNDQDRAFQENNNSNILTNNGNLSKLECLQKYTNK